MVTLMRQLQEDPREMRTVYFQALLDAAESDPNIFVLDCDLARSIGSAPFIQRFPDRHLDCGIQEANACGLAAGMSLRGFVPFVQSFGVFASRRILDQIYISCAYAGLNVKIIGADPGVTAAVNGGTHMALEDAGILRAVPGVTIIEPSDPVMMYQVVRQMTEHYGVDYLRLNRKKAVRLYTEDSSFTIGKGALIRDGADVTIFACGIMVHEALKAAEILEREGISARVVDMFTIKPIDADMIVESAERTGAVVTAENHSIIGGLGSAVAEVLGEKCPVPLERVGVMDRFGEVGSVDYLKERFGLTDQQIAEKARRAVRRKSAAGASGPR
ncbi:MAG: transketolase family protein [Clostridia bacterium]|nr:transketolase family protein [Clostridia bacterium]